MLANPRISTDATSTNSSAKLLVVDDDAMLTHVVSTMMNHWGYQVVSAPTIDNARTILQSEPFDIVLSDLMINGNDNGLGFLTSVLTAGYCRAAVLMSGHPRRAELESQLSPTLRFIQKPFRAPELDETLQSALAAAA